MTSLNHPDGRVLRINVGFLLKEGAGYVRDIEFREHGPIPTDEIALLELEGVLRFTRTPQGVLVQGQLSAIREIECVRCLAPLGLPFEMDFSDLFRPAGTSSEVDEINHRVISEGDDIDLAPIMREEAILAEPMHAVCGEDCKGLCATCGKNLNEGPCDCEQDDIDPRMAVLRTLLEDE